MAFRALEDDPRYLRTRLLSFEVTYLDGRLFLAVTDGKEPWNRLMVCTSRNHHAELIAKYPQLASHKVLGKQLDISRANPEFESVAQALVLMAKRWDVAWGIEP